MDIEQFYREFVRSFDDTEIEDTYVSALEEFGIDTKDGSFGGVSAEDKELLEKGREEAYKKIVKYGGSGAKTVGSNGWWYVLGNGEFGSNHLHRAQVSYFGYGANLAEDSIYPHFTVLPDGSNLESDKKYIIHFEKGKLPEAEFFWSLTVYGLPSQYLTENELNRYMINSHDKGLYENEDGSIDIILQNTRPEDEKKLPNWLPTPKDEKYFDLTIRIYGPSKEQLDGVWEGPKVIAI